MFTSEHQSKAIVTLKINALILDCQTILCETKAAKQCRKENGNCFHGQGFTRTLATTPREWQESSEELRIYGRKTFGLFQTAGSRCTDHKLTKTTVSFGMIKSLMFVSVVVDRGIARDAMLVTLNSS